MSRHDVVKRHDFRSTMKSKEKLSSMRSVRFDGIYTGKHGGGVCPYIYIILGLYFSLVLSGKERTNLTTSRNIEAYTNRNSSHVTKR